MKNKFFLRLTKIFTFCFTYFVFENLFSFYRLVALEDDQPVVRLVCRSPDAKGFLIEYDAKNLNGNKITLDYKKGWDKYSWSCPDVLNPHPCPFSLGDKYEIKTPLFLIINNPNLNQIAFHKKNIAACNRSKPKDALPVFEYGYKTNFDKSTFGRILHQPVFADRSLQKNFSFNRIIVFGDSFSDNGKMWEVVPIPLIGVWPYFFGRYSNGPVWNEQIVRKLMESGIYVDMLNLAIAGSSVLPGLGDLGKMNLTFMGQIEQYLSIIDPKNQPINTYFTIANSVFLIMAGLSDIRDIIRLDGDNDSKDIRTICDGATAQDCAKKIIIKDKNSIYAGILKLIKAGGTNFMISDIPNILKFPRYAKETQESQIKFIETLISEYNKNITEELITSLTTYPNVKIIKIDLSNLYGKLLESHSKFAAKVSILNNSERCNLDEVFPTYCKQPEFYLFWDDIHPTETAHCLISERILELMYESFDNLGRTYKSKYSNCAHSFIH